MNENEQRPDVPKHKQGDNSFSGRHKGNAYNANNQTLIGSHEVEKLQKLIDGKKDYYRKVKNPAHARFLQDEILFLQNQILPTVLRETTLLFSEFTNYFERGLKKSIDAKCDAMLMLVPLVDGLNDTCKIGIINPKAQSFGENAIESIDVAIECMGVGRRKIEPYNIELE